MLDVADLEVRYGRVAALQALSLAVGGGEAVGIIGPNGAGKSSTLNAIFGLVAATAGRISFNDRPLLGLRPEAIAELGLSIVPEGRHIFGTLTVEENLELGTTLRRDRRQAQLDIQATFERFPILGRYSNTSAGRLSGGEQQQLAIARALLSRPKLLLLDEPSLGLAPLLVDQIFDLLTELKNDGMTILLVEQVAARTIEFADRTYILRSGALVAAGSRAELQSRPALIQAYLGV